MSKTTELPSLPVGLKQVLSKEAHKHWHNNNIVFTQYIDGKVWRHDIPEHNFMGFVNDGEGYTFHIIWTKLHELFYEIK